MPVFEAEGDHWSLGVTDPADPSRAIAIAEKQPISNLASIGHCGFRRIEQFRQPAALQLQQANPVAGELCATFGISLNALLTENR